MKSIISVSLPRCRLCLATQRSLGRSVAWRDKNGCEGDYTSVKVLLKRISFKWSQCRSSSTDLGDSIVHSGSERSNICQPEEGWYGRNIVMKKQYTLLWSALKWSERGNLPTIQLCHRRSLSTIPPLLSTKKKKSELTKSIGQQNINDVYAVPEFHFQSQLELYPF